jgi:hypothetical protein
MSMVEGPDPEGGTRPLQGDLAMQRFTRAALVASVVALVPFIWTLWDGRLDPLRRFGYATAFYDVQARALFDGHFWLPDGSIGVEAFVVDGRTHIYFGLFPTVLRMPIMALTDAYDGALTAPSMLLAWLVTAAFTSMLLWRVRVMLRGQAPLGRAEAAGSALFIGSVLSGSTLLYLAAQPAVFYEALFWGVAFTVMSIFALLGVIERASGWRVLALGAAVLGAVSSRSTVGWACVIGVVMLAVWFAAGRGGADGRRWWPALLLAALVPLAAGAAVNWARFGGPFDLPLEAQTDPAIADNRLPFLEANDGQAFAPRFVPTNALAYLRPNGLKISRVYPFITKPDTPPPVLGDVVFERTYRTASIPSSMPLLFVLTVGGALVAFRPRAGPAAALRIPLLVGAGGTGGVLLFGFLVHRYLADFLPLLVVAGAVGTVGLWQRIERHGRVRSVVVGCTALLAVFGLAANLGIATEAIRMVWEDDDLHGYVSRQKTLVDRFGGDIEIMVAERVPDWLPAGRLVATPNCAALYISTGEYYHPRYRAVERGPGTVHRLEITYTERDWGPVTLLTLAPDTTVAIEDRGIDFARYVRLRVESPEGLHLTDWTPMELGEPRMIEVLTDTALQRLSASIDGHQVIEIRGITGDQPVEVEGRAPALNLGIDPQPVPDPELCSRFFGAR